MTTRCEAGRLMRWEPPSFGDPGFETDIGECGECEGRGCGSVQDYEFRLKRCNEHATYWWERAKLLKRALGEIFDMLPDRVDDAKMLAGKYGEIKF